MSEIRDSSRSTPPNWCASLRELAATSYLRGHMNFIIALAIANLCKLQHSAELQAF